MKTFTKKEIIAIIISIFVFWIIIGISYNSETESLQFQFNPLYILIPAIIIPTTILAKKFTAPRYSTKIEHKIWIFQKYWFYKGAYLKKPIPMGIIFPLIISFLTLGFLKPLALLQFTPENLPHKRIQKKQGTRRAERKFDLNESDMAFISVYGFYSLLLLSLITSIITLKYNFQFTYLLAKYSIYYGAWNLVPWGHLDGAKTFYGSPVSFTTLLFFYLIALGIIGVTAIF